MDQVFGEQAKWVSVDTLSTSGCEIKTDRTVLGITTEKPSLAKIF